MLLHTNVNGPQRLMNFAKSCKNLEILVHFSTGESEILMDLTMPIYFINISEIQLLITMIFVAYVNGEKEGMIPETPLIMGENKRNDKSRDASFTRFDTADEIKLALSSCKATTNYEMTKHMRKLGMERLRPFLFISYIYCIFV